MYTLLLYILGGDRREEKRRGGHNNAWAANLPVMGHPLGAVSAAFNEKATGLVTALCVLLTLIPLTDIILQLSNGDRLICLLPRALLGSLVLSGHRHWQFMQRCERAGNGCSVISARRRTICSVEYWFGTFENA